MAVIRFLLLISAMATLSVGCGFESQTKGFTSGNKTEKASGQTERLPPIMLTPPLVPGYRLDNCWTTGSQAICGGQETDQPAQGVVVVLNSKTTRIISILSTSRQDGSLRIVSANSKGEVLKAEDGALYFFTNHADTLARE